MSRDLEMSCPLRLGPIGMGVHMTAQVFPIQLGVAKRGRILLCASLHIRIQSAKITRTYDGLDRLTQEVTSEGDGELHLRYCQPPSDDVRLAYKQGATKLRIYTYEAVGNRIKTGDTFARIDLPSPSPVQATTPIISRPRSARVQKAA